MENKKQSKEWKIAAMHFLLSCAVALIIIAMVMFILFPMIIFGAIDVFIDFFCVVSILSIWSGVRTSGIYITKSYEIENKDKVIILATIYYVIVMIVWSIVDPRIIAWFVDSGVVSLSYNYIFAEWLFKIIGTIIFYMAGKSYIKNTAIIQQ